MLASEHIYIRCRNWIRARVQATKADGLPTLTADDIRYLVRDRFKNDKELASPSELDLLADEMVQELEL